MTSKKSRMFNRVLLQAKEALDSENIPFHLHSGTALGAHREHDFIEHDDDIDLAVFYSDVNDPIDVKRLVKAMEMNGFELLSKLGKLSSGLEIKFIDVKTEIPLDIFWVYEGEYRGQDYYIIHSYYGKCDEYKHKACVWGYRPYRTVRVNFLGETYNCMPKKTLVDAYGTDWNVPKKFNYYDGLDSGYKSLLPDYYNPRNVDKKVAFCFLVYDRVIHEKAWVDFFKEDNLPIKSYSIYSHIKTVTDSTQQWLIDNKIRTIKTEWCDESLFWAWCNMLKEGLKDKSNEYFVLLSGECIPLYGYWDTYKRITSSKKSRVNRVLGTEPTDETGLAYADQWVILTRKHALELLKLKTTEDGKKFLKYLRNTIDRFCPDELYPVNWFLHRYSPSGFKKEFRTIPTTFTYWDGVHSSPIRYNTPKMRKHIKKICGSDALFARKFNKKAGRELARNCPT